MSRYKSDFERALAIGLPVSIILTLLLAAFDLIVHDNIYLGFRDFFQFNYDFVTLTLLLIPSMGILTAGILYLFRLVQPNRFPRTDTGIITTVFFLFTSTTASLIVLEFFSRVVFPHFLLSIWSRLILSTILVINCCGVSALVSIFVNLVARNFLDSLYPRPPLREMYLVLLPVIILLLFGVFLANDIRDTGQDSSKHPVQTNNDSSGVAVSKVKFLSEDSEIGDR